VSSKICSTWNNQSKGLEPSKGARRGLGVLETG